MKNLLRVLARRHVRNQDGATMIEYALIAGLIAVVAVTAITSVGTDVTAKFTAIANAL